MPVINQVLAARMGIAGEELHTGQVFPAQMVIAANAMQPGMGLLQPGPLARQQTVEVPGVSVIGTVRSDIDEIGKSLVATMVLASGLRVKHPGVDVAPEMFVNKVQETGRSGPECSHASASGDRRARQPGGAAARRLVGLDKVCPPSHLRTGGARSCSVDPHPVLPRDLFLHGAVIG